MIELKTDNEETNKVLQSDEVQQAIQKALDEQTTGLKSKRDELLTTISKNKTTLSELNELGGLDKFKELQDGIAAAEMATAEKNGDLESIKTAHTKQIIELTSTIDNLKATAVQKDLSTLVTNEIKSQNGIPELLVPLINGRIKGQYSETGAINYQVMNEDGSPMLTSEGRDATLSDLVSSLKANDTFSTVFKGTGSSGMNSSQSNDVGVSSDNPFADYGKETFDLTKAMAFFKINPEKAKGLAKAAGFPLSA